MAALAEDGTRTRNIRAGSAVDGTEKAKKATRRPPQKRPNSGRDIEEKPR